MKEFLIEVLTPELLGAMLFMGVNLIVLFIVGIIEYNKDIKRKKLARIEEMKNAEKERLIAIQKKQEEDYRRLVSMNIAISSKK